MRLVALTVAVFALTARADDPKPAPAPARELVVGTWKMTRTDNDLPKGATAGLVVEKDGALKLSMTLNGKTDLIKGKYKFDGDKVMVVTVTDPAGETREERLAIEVTAKTLKLTDSRKKVEEFERADEPKKK